MTLKIPFIFSLIIHVIIIAIFTLNEQSLVKTKTSIIKIDIISTKVESVDKIFVHHNKVSKEKNLVNKNTINAINEKNEDIYSLKTFNQASSQNYPKNLVSQKLPETFKAKYYIGSENNPPPKYPLIARKRGWEGTVLLSVTVNEDGTVDNIEIEKSTGFQILDDVSLQTIKKWFFVPAKQGNNNIKDIIKIPVRFSLN